ncbi:MAG: hypothetical protein WAO02_09760 [Verrucomicrobiia bacterium]
MIRFRELERSFKDRRKLWFFFNVRWLERRLSVSSLHWILGAHAFVRAALTRNHVAMPLPACFGASMPGRAIRESRMQDSLNKLLEYFPERLSEPKWMNRCRIEGLDPVLRARQEGRPVVLAFSHFSAFRLCRFWLRAAGIPAATLIVGKAENRANLELLEDRFTPFPEIPTSFYQDQLHAVNGFLAGGNALLIAVDSAAGKQMNVPVCEGWSFQMATGAVRLAIRHQAELISCAVIDEGRWRFQMKLGRPVPAACLAAKVDWIHAGKHLFNEMLPDFRNHSEQCSHQLIKCFQPSPQPSLMEDPPEKFVQAHQAAP